MSMNVSAFGLRVQVVASVTFPNGFTVTQFPDDADAIDMPETTVGEAGMGPNGDLIQWQRPNPLPFSMNVIPGSDDDQNLTTLFDANRVGKGKVGARDAITITVMYPDGRQATLAQAMCQTAVLVRGVAANGRAKTKNFKFLAENMTRSGS